MTICLHNGTILNGFSKMEKCAVLIKDNKIEDVFSEERFLQKKLEDVDLIVDVHESYISPGLIDTHIHGFKGHGTDTCTSDNILQMSKDLVEFGVTSFNPTLYTSTEDVLTSNIKEVVKAIKIQSESFESAVKKEQIEDVSQAKNATTTSTTQITQPLQTQVGSQKIGAHIMGLHLEGPFISLAKLGVQRPEMVSHVDLNLMERLWNASEGKIVNMTVAPELKGMRHLALSCLQKGIVLQAGHTDAAYKNMVEGMQAGIFHSTHLFNAMSQLHHRNPGAVGAVLTHSEMTCEIIADGVHVHPDLFKLLQKDKTSDQIVLITDALTPTEQRDEQLFANGEEVVFKDGCFHRKSDDVIAGSALTMIVGVKNLVKFGFSINDAIKCATANPARIMHYSTKGFLIPGYDSDLIVFDKEFNIQLVMISGHIVVNKM